MQLREDGHGNLRADPIPTSEDLGRFYASLFDRTAYNRGGKAWQGWHRALRLAAFGFWRPLAMLDYGCGNGQFLRACRSVFSQAQIAGFEMSADACEAATRRSGCPVFNDLSLIKARFPDGCDLITAWHVVEHSPEPGPLVAALAQLLKPGGRLVIAVPNRQAAGMEMMKADWPWCQAPFLHVWHFSAAGLSALARDAAPQCAIRSHTRDAWDCNHVMDWFVSKALRLPQWPNRWLALRLDSYLRLALSVLNEAVLNPFYFRHSGTGAELIVELQRKQ